MSAYLDGELTPRRRRRLEAHAAACPECAPLLRTLKVIVLELHGLGRRRDHTVAEVVLERLRAEGPPPRRTAGFASRLGLSRSP